MRNLDNFRQEWESGKSKKLKSNGLHLSEKYIPSAKTLYTEELSSISLNYLFESSPNFLCHFWNHKSFFMTQLVCIILAETLHTLDKKNPIKVQIFRVFTAWLKFIKILMSFFKQKVRFSSKFGSPFSAMRGNTSALF